VLFSVFDRYPRDLVIENSNKPNTIYITDLNNNRIRKISLNTNMLTTNGTVTSLAGGGI
jgi:hypothetical protein